MSKIISPILGVFGAIASFIPGLQPLAFVFFGAKMGLDYITTRNANGRPRGGVNPISVQAAPPPFSTTVEHPITPRMISYGRVKNPGAFFWKEAGPLKSNLSYGLYMCEGPISLLESITCDDELVPWITGSGVVSPASPQPSSLWVPNSGTKYIGWNNGSFAYSSPVVIVETINATEAGYHSYLLGTLQPSGQFSASNTADAGMAGFWDSSHLGKGVTAFYVYSYVGNTGQISINTVRQQIYPNNWPIFNFVYRGAPVYDPRDSSQSEHHPQTGLYTIYNPTWVWSENPALIAADYVNRLIHDSNTAIVGIDWDSIAEAANDCDRLCPCYVKNFGGGGISYEPFARFTGNISLELEPRDVLSNIMAVCDGAYGVNADGLFTMWVGKWEEPNVVFTDADISSIQEEFGPALAEETNYINITYTEPRQNYTPVQAPIYEDLESQARIGRRTSQYQIDNCPSPSQAWRMTRRHIMRQNGRRRLTLRLGARGVMAAGQRVVGLNCQAFAISGTFRVISLAPEGSLAEWSVQLAEITPEIFDDPAPPLDPLRDFLQVRAPAVPTPSSFAVTRAPLEDGTTALKVDWAQKATYDANNPAVLATLLADPNYMWDASYSTNAGATYSQVNVRLSEFSVRTPGFAAGTTVYVRTRFIAGNGTLGAWSAATIITI